MARRPKKRPNKTNKSANSAPTTDGGPVRVQKVLSRAGIASRRGAEQLILDGRVSVNGVVIEQLGTKVTVGVDEHLSLQLGAHPHERLSRRRAVP